MLDMQAWLRAALAALPRPGNRRSPGDGACGAQSLRASRACPRPPLRRFLLISGSGVPLYDPLTFYQRLMAAPKSYVSACWDAHKQAREIWTPQMQVGRAVLYTCATRLCCAAWCHAVLRSVCQPGRTPCQSRKASPEMQTL